MKQNRQGRLYNFTADNTHISDIYQSIYTDWLMLSIFLHAWQIMHMAIPWGLIKSLPLEHSFCFFCYLYSACFLHLFQAQIWMCRFYVDKQGCSGMKQSPSFANDLSHPSLPLLFLSFYRKGNPKMGLQRGRRNTLPLHAVGSSKRME